MMLCAVLLLAPMACARADDTVDADWMLSEPFVPHTAPKATPAEPVELPEAPPLEEAPTPQSEVEETTLAPGDATTPEPESPSPVVDDTSPETKVHSEAEVKSDVEPHARPALDEVLSFRQEGAPDLRYKWDVHTKMWSAESLQPMAYPVYVTNNADQTIGPFAVSASADMALDDGGLFRLEARLFETSQNLTLLPHASACIGELVFSGSGGQTATASSNALVIDLSAIYLN